METDRAEALEREYQTRKIHDALKAADALNRIFGPALRAYHDEMKRLATIAGRPLYSCLPGEGTICVEPEANTEAS